MQSRITSTTENPREIRQTENKLADIWIKRWVRFARRGLPDVGYPKRAAFADSNWYYNPDDEPTYLDERIKAMLDKCKGKVRDIILDFYFLEMSLSAVALKNGLKKSGAQWRIDTIRNQVLKIIKSEA